MALTRRLVASAAGPGDVLTTASFTVAAGEMVVVCATSTGSSGASGAVTVTTSLSGVTLTKRVEDATTTKVTAGIYSGVSAGATSGTVTATFSGTTADANVLVYALAGFNPVTPLGGNGQGTSAAAAVSCTLSAAPLTTSTTLALVVSRNKSTGLFVTGAGFSSVDEIVHVTPSAGTLVQTRTASTSTAVAADGMASISNAVVALVVNADTTTPPAPSTSNVYVWNGTTMLDADAYVWNGTTMIEADFDAIAGATVMAPSWKWHGSAIDSTGGNMNTVYDGTTWYTAVDIAGIARLDSMAAGTVPQWQQGRGVIAGNLDSQSSKCSGMTSNGSKAWAVGGVMPGGGAIQSRDIAGGGIWQYETTAYSGDVSGVIGFGRPTGHRRIYHDTAKNAVYVCAQKVSTGNGGIARKVGGGSFSDFDAPNGHTLGRMWRAVVGSAVGYTDTMYACANSATGDGAGAGGAPCVAVYTGSSTISPSYLRIDNIGTGNPGGLTDAQDMIVINEGGSDALYVVVGEGDATNGGLWRCTINGDPTSPGWKSSPSLTWVKLNGATLSAAHQYRTLTGKRVGSATYLMVFNNPAGGGTAPALSGNIPIVASKYVAAVYRTFTGHTSTPTWQAITDAANISPGGVHNPVFGTSSETWVQMTGAQSAASNKCVLGGSSWGAFDADIDPTNDVVVVAGKSASWITQNPWAASASAVQWRVFANSTGGIITDHIGIHPSDNLKWTMTDVDRGAYYSLNGGDGQMHGTQNSLPTATESNWVRQGGSNPGRWLLGSSLGGNVYTCDTWHTTTDPNESPTFATDSVTGFSGGINGVAEITYAGTDYRIVVGDDGHVRIKSGGTWADKFSLGVVSGKDVTIIANDGFKDFWILETKTGLWYVPDVTAAAGTSIFPVSVTSSDNSFCGRVAQDATTRTTLYVTWGKALPGVWKLTGANNLTVNASGAKTGGTGTVSTMTGTDLPAGTPCGSINVDTSNGDIILLIPGYTGTPDALIYNGTDWNSIADDTFREVSILPVSVAKRGNRIYAGQFNSGTPFAVFD